MKIGTEELLFFFLVLCYMRCLKKGKREEEHKFEKVNDDVWIGGVLVKCELKGKKDLCVLYGRLIDINACCLLLAKWQSKLSFFSTPIRLIFND